MFIDKLERKRNVLEDGINLYLNLGKLTPNEQQEIHPGPLGCTSIMFDKFFENRENLEQQNEVSLSIDQLKEENLVKIQFDLPRSLTGLSNIDVAMRNSNCDLIVSETLVEKSQTIYMTHIQGTRKWKECDKDSNCFDSATGLEGINDYMICYKIFCFEYSHDGKLVITQDTLQQLDQG